MCQDFLSLDYCRKQGRVSHRGPTTDRCVMCPCCRAELFNPHLPRNHLGILLKCRFLSGRQGLDGRDSAFLKSSPVTLMLQISGPCLRETRRRRWRLRGDGRQGGQEGPLGRGRWSSPESYLSSGSSENSLPPCTHRMSLPLGPYMSSLFPLLPGPRSLPTASEAAAKPAATR